MGILEDLLAATLRNNELMEQAAAGREEVLAAAKAATTKPAAKPKAETPAAETKTETKSEPAAETKPAAETSDGPTVQDVNDAISGYVGGTNDAEERAARAAKVKGVLTKFSPEGTEKVNGGTLLADKRAAFIKTVAKWVEEGNLIVKEEAAAADDDGLLG